ncbi:hypothetical protein G7K_2049-t1 [Saitoella complicata NRRL Y-17804]|uniref:Uncharacterized protein n=1 Tax=Saitoella complicata (strain BCRC 22490 / CBS 7301 / JCM 7358 / NBRC 10748 / NRRL Y-17804) TaxID=698492 RepID=A0A0E9NDF5_SAICN|nr:hypothetical protein G7K_2049-t1 [Saitoella complicata NRRL Y-17804]
MDTFRRAGGAIIWQLALVFESGRGEIRSATGRERDGWQLTTGQRSPIPSSSSAAGTSLRVCTVWRKNEAQSSQSHKFMHRTKAKFGELVLYIHAHDLGEKQTGRAVDLSDRSGDKLLAAPLTKPLPHDLGRGHRRS